ncbi:MAG: hypothetical protein Aurels2KO_19230 [Aureliella sp.]
MSSIQAGIDSKDGGQPPSGDRGRSKSRGGTEKIRPQSELKSHLEKTARFIKAFDILVRGFAWISCILAAWLLACLVDHWLLPLPSVLRWLAWGALVAFTVWIAVWQIVPLIIGRINPDYAAKRIERAEPRFKEGLIAWLQLSEMSDSGVPRGVMAAMTHRAYRFIGGQDPSSTVDSSPLIRGLASVMVLACVMALYSFISPKSSLATATRIAMPWRTVAAPTRVQLSEVIPGATTVSAGKPLDVSVRAIGVRPGEPVHLLFSTRDGQIVNQAIALNEPDVGSIYSGALTTTGSGIEHELQYWIEAGDAVSERFDIQLAPTPSVVLDRVELVYPPYTKLPKRISDGRDLEAIEGTIATVVARSNQDLVRGQLEINPTQDPNGLLLSAEQVLPLDVAGRELKREWQPLLREGETSSTVRYSVRGYNERGDANLNPIEHSLALVADVPPEVRLVGPKNRILRVRPTSKVQLEIRASDPDFGLNEVELSVHKAGAAVASRVIVKGDGLKGKQVKRQPLDISRLSMSPGDRLELHAVARDNRHDPTSGKWSPNETHADPLIVEVVGPSQQSDVPSGNENPGADGQPDSGADNRPENENPRPGSTNSNNGQSQTQDPSQSGETKASPDQNQSGSNQSNTNDPGKQDSSDEAGKQSGSGGGAGSSSDESGEAQSSSDQSTGAGGSSSNSESESPNDNSSGGGNSTSGGNQSQDSSSEQSQRNGSGGQSQDNASQNSSNNAGQNGSNQGNSEGSSSNSQPQGASGGQRMSNPNNRVGTGGSPNSDAQAMKRVEDFMREKGEASAQQGKSQSGGQSQSGQSSESPEQSGGQNQESNAGEQQGSSSGEQTSSDPSGNSGSNSKGSQSKPSTTDQSSDSSGSNDSQAQNDASSNDQPGDSKSSSGANDQAGENGSQNSGGQNSGNQDAASQSNTGTNQDGSSSQQNNQDSSQQSSNDANSGTSNSSNNGSSSQDGQGGNSQSGQSQDGAGGKSEQGKSGAGNSGQSSSGQDQSSSSESSTGKSGESSPGEGGASGANQQDAGQQGKNQSSGKSGEAQSSGEKDGARNKPADGQESNAQDTRDQNSSGQNSGGQSGANPGAKNEGPRGQQSPKQPNEQTSPNGQPTSPEGSASEQPQSGNNSSGQEQSTQSQGGSKSASGSGNSDSGNSTNSSGRGSNKGSTNRDGGNVGNAEAADKAAAAQAADMVLDYLDRQRDQPDPELLREVNWDKNDLNRFVDRWKQARQLASQGDDTAKQNWEELLSELNLSRSRSGSFGPMKQSDRFQQISDSAVRITPPRSLLKRWEAVQRALEKR